MPIIGNHFDLEIPFTGPNMAKAGELPELGPRPGFQRQQAVLAQPGR